LGKDALIGGERVWALVALETVERMRVDVAAAQRVAEDAAERAEDALDRPGRQSTGAQLVHDVHDVVRADQRQPTPAEPRQQMQSQLRAVEVERPLAPCAVGDLGLKLGKPPRSDLGKREPWRERQCTHAARSFEQHPQSSRFVESCRVERAEARPTRNHHADGVFAVLLLVDPALKATPLWTAACIHRILRCLSDRSGKDDELVATIDLSASRRYPPGDADLSFDW